MIIPALITALAEAEDPVLAEALAWGPFTLIVLFG
jgi:hypothetical protein